MALNYPGIFDSFYLTADRSDEQEEVTMDDSDIFDLAGAASQFAHGLRDYNTGYGEISDERADLDTISHAQSTVSDAGNVGLYGTQSGQGLRRGSSVRPPGLANYLDLLASRTPTNIPMAVQLPKRDGDLAFGHLLSLAADFYNSRLYSNHSDTTTPDSIATPLSLNQANDFWTNLKNGIYMLNSKDEKGYVIINNTVTEQTVANALGPLSLLRELLATLSQANLRMYSGFRPWLLGAFANQARKCGSSASSSLSEMCEILSEPWVKDQAITTVLQMLVQQMDTHAEQHKDTASSKNHMTEAVLLRRALVQLLRRRGELASADRAATKAQAAAETIHGPDSVETRLIMSERVYILNRQQEWHRSLSIALEIVDRARRYEAAEGISFPSRRAIFHMEDLAEICQIVGQRSEARKWLRQAMQGALKNWDSQSSTMILYDKLLRLEIDMEMRSPEGTGMDAGADTDTETETDTDTGDGGR